MMDNQVLQTLQSRFSCRKFTDRSIEEEKIRAVIEAAKYAPNGKNAQGWHFTIIRSEEGRKLLLQAAGDTPPEQFLKMMPSEKWPFQGDFCGAPVVILVSGKTDVPWPEVGAHLAVGNLMTAATSLGLATLWSTVFTRDLFRDEKSTSVKPLLIPEGNELYAAIFLGYPENIPQKRPSRRDGVETWI